MTPDFDHRGLLPPGDYEVTFEQLANSTLVAGPEDGSVPDWNSEWRRHLVSQTEILVTQLWEVGVSDVFVDGSFVEKKPHPNDVDGYFVCDLRELNVTQTSRRE